ncbi:MAG: YDG domain-containing protein [Sphingobacteriales bacterium]
MKKSLLHLIDSSGQAAVKFLLQVFLILKKDLTTFKKLSNPGLPGKAILFALIFVMANLFLTNKTSAANYQLPAGSYVYSSGTATYGTVSTVTYTISYTIATTAGSSNQDQLALAWTSGAPTGVTYAFTTTFGSLGLTGSANAAASFSPTLTGTKTITLTITTSTATPTSTSGYGFTLTTTDNNGGVSGSSSGLALVVTGPKTVTGIATGSQTGTATFGTAAPAITYTNTLTETGTTAAASNSISVAWSGGTPTGVTTAFTAGTQAMTSGSAYTPNGTNGSTITLTVSTTAATPAGTYTFTVTNVDNNGGGTTTSTGTLLVSSSAKRVTAIATGSQTGTATFGTAAPAITYTNTLTETGTTAAAANSISVVWSGGTPTGVTTAFTAGTQAMTSGSAYTPNGTNGSTITLTVSTTAATPAGTYTFTVTNVDNNGGGTTTSTGTLLVSAVVRMVTAIATGSQTGTATYGAAAPVITYTNTLTETGTTAAVANSISVAWSGGTPTGVTTAFTAGTQAMTSGSAYTPNGTNGSTITLTVSTTAATPAGTYTFTVTNADNNGGGTTISTGTLVVAAKALTITGAAASNKVYDGTTTATITGTLSGIVGSDIVTLNGTGTFASANVANGIAVTSTSTLGGANAGNYTLTQPVGLTANITGAPLTVTATGPAKTYGTALTAGTGTINFTASAAIGSEAATSVTLTPNAAGLSAATAVGAAYIVTPTLATGTGGFLAGNYIITYVPYNGTVAIAPLTITANNVSKVYGNTLTGGAGSVAFTAAGLQNGETIGSVTIAYGTGSAASAPVAVNTGTATAGGATGGTFNPANYSITYVAGNITVTAKALTITGAAASNKVYDGTTAATITGTLSGIVGADVVTLNGTGTFASANVANGIAVTSTSTLVGANAGNYTLTQPAGLTANITAKALTVTGAVASNKVYDGTTTATITGGTLTGVISPDVVSISGTFASKNVGTGIVVTLALTGANAGNYTLTQPGITANITVMTLTITGLTASNKTYDGTTTATLAGSATLNGVIAADVSNVALSGLVSAVFSSANVGTGLAVTVSGYTLTGTAAGNYILTQPAGLTANITTAALTIAATGPVKVAGSTQANLSGAGSAGLFNYIGTVPGESIASVTLTLSNTASQTAGSTYTVTPSLPIGAGGFLASNYSITYLAYSGIVAGHIYTWTGGSNTTSWTTSGNWSSFPSGGTYPANAVTYDSVILPSGTTYTPTLSTGITLNTLNFTGNNTLTIASAQNLIISNGFSVNSGVTAANLSFLGASASTAVELSSASFTNSGSFNIYGTGLLQVDAGSYIYNSGTFTAYNGSTLYVTNSSGNNAITNTGTFHVGTEPTPSTSSAAFIEMDDYGSILNSGQFYLGPTSLMYYYNSSSKSCIINNQSGGTFTLQSNAAGSASIGQIPVTSPVNQFIGTFSVERYFQGGSTISTGRYVERNYRIISSPVNTGTIVNGNYVFGLNYIVGATAGQTTAANSATNAFITGCSGGSTSIGNPSVYLYNENKTPNNASFITGNFLGITNITNSTSGGTITASDGGTYSLPVGTGVFFFFRGAATNWATRTIAPYIAPENVTLTSEGYMNQGTYTFKDWYAPALTTIGYSVTAGNAAVRGFNMIGNPYPCAIDWCTAYAPSAGTGITRTNVNPTIWEYDPVANHYWTYQATSSGGGTATGNASRYIMSGQGFFVQANLASPALTIYETAKVVLQQNNGVGTGAVPALAQLTGSGLLMSKALVQNVVPQSLRLKLVVDSINYDETYIGFNAAASLNYNGDEDAQYIAGSSPPESLSSFSSDNIKLSINNLPLPKQTAQVVRLHVGGTANGTYTLQRTALEAIPKIYEIWLMDKYKKDSLDIRNNTTYKFNINLSDTGSYGNNRFNLIIRQNPALGVHLLSFKADKATGGAQVVWITENEENYTNFTVERSTDNGATFSVVGGFASNALGTYSLLDQNPVTGANQYRLKLEDLNGTVTYSSIVTVMYGTGSETLAKNSINIYPNPVKSTLNLTITPPFASGATQTGGPVSRPSTTVYGIRIVNTLGSVVQSANTAQVTWQTDVSSLTPGTYILQVVNNYDNSVVGKGTFVKL